MVAWWVEPTADKMVVVTADCWVARRVVSLAASLVEMTGGNSVVYWVD